MTKDEKAKFTAELEKIETDFGGGKIFNDGPAKAGALMAMSTTKLLELIARILIAKD